MSVQGVNESGQSSAASRYAGMSAHDAVFFVMIAMYKMAELQMFNRMEKIEDILDEIEEKQELRNYLDSLMDEAKENDQDISVDRMNGSKSASGDMDVAYEYDTDGATITKITVEWGDYKLELDLGVLSERNVTITLYHNGVEEFVAWGDPHANIGGDGIDGTKVDFDFYDENLTLILDDGTKITIGTEEISNQNRNQYYIDSVYISTPDGQGFSATSDWDSDTTSWEGLTVTTGTASEIDALAEDGYAFYFDMAGNKLQSVNNDGTNGAITNDNTREDLASDSVQKSGKSYNADILNHIDTIDHVDTITTGGANWADGEQSWYGFDGPREFFEWVEDELGIEIDWEDGFITTTDLKNIIDGLDDYTDNLASVNQIEMLKLQRLLNILNLVVQTLTSMESSKQDSLMAVARNL